MTVIKCDLCKGAIKKQSVRAGIPLQISPVGAFNGMGEAIVIGPGFFNQLVENNLFVNNSVHLMLFFGVQESVFRNNTFVATSG